jgi:hypothetical protein
VNVSTRLFFRSAIVFAIALAAPAVRAQGVNVDEQKATGAEQSVLASAKELYASASYEAALIELTALDTTNSEDADEVDTYRALCQLALDRPRDAEQTLEQLVTRRPQFALDDSQYSPRLISLFHDVRKRVLPGVVRQLYSAAKGEYEGKNYSLASTKFQQLLSLLGDPDLSDQDAAQSDLKELADGFLKLSDLRLADGAPAPAAAAAASSSSAGRPVAPTTYTLLEPGIRPPVVVSQVLPTWRPPQQSQYLLNRVYSGRLELVINEQGGVETATLVRSIWPSYDGLVLEAAKRWRYQPALKDGRPVRFRKFLDITVNESESATPRR